MHKLTNPGLIVQLLPKILVHSPSASLAASSLSSSGTAAPAVTPVENTALSGRVHWERGRHRLAATWHQLSIPVYLRGDAINAAVSVLASLAQNTWDVLIQGRNRTDLLPHRQTSGTHLSTHSSNKSDWVDWPIHLTIKHKRFLSLFLLYICMWLDPLLHSQCVFSYVLKASASLRARRSLCFHTFPSPNWVSLCSFLLCFSVLSVYLYPV